MRLIKYFVLSLVLSPFLATAAPDYQYTYRFTNRTGEPTDSITVYNGASATVAINNKLSACAGWQLSYNSEGFSALSITLQSAPNSVTTTGTAPGSWSTYSGTNVTGSLPMTSTAGGLYISYGYYPYMRVNLTSATGTGSVDVQLSCWKSIAYVAGLSSSGGSVGPGTATKIPKFATTTTVGDSSITDDGSTVSTTEPVHSDVGFTSGTGGTPGLDIELCGTAPSAPSAGNVSEYCTSKIQKWKNEDGTVFEGIQGIANPSDANCVTYVDVNGAQQRAACGGFTFSVGTSAATSVPNTDTVLGVTGTLAALGAGHCYEFKAEIYVTVFASASDVLKVWYGTAPGTTGDVATFNGGSSMLSDTTHPLLIEGAICNKNGVQNAQTISLYPNFNQGTGGFGVITTTAAQDATLTTLKIGVTIASGGSTNTMVLSYLRGSLI